MDASVTPAPTSVPRRRWSRWDLAALVAITAGPFAMSAVSPAPLVDPDRSFRFELSRRVLQVGLGRDLPQVSDTASGPDGGA